MSRFKSPWVAWLVIFTFSFTAVIGAHIWNPTPAFAWDIPDDQGHAGTKPTQAQETNCGEKDCTDQRSPVQIKQGNYVYSHTDLFIPGLGIPLEVTRHYDSQDMYDGPFGYGWKWGLEIKLIEITDESGDHVTIRRGDGTRREFTRNPDGSYSPPAGWEEYLGKNEDGTFTWCESSSGNASGGLGTCYDFDSSGYLITVQDRNGNQMSFSYDGTGKLTQVTDASGRFLTIAYGANNKIASIKDPADRVFTYGYDSSGNLTSYTDPLGNITTYSYDAKHHLTKITDARGNTVTEIAYYVEDDYKNDDGTYSLKKDLYRVKTYTEYDITWTYTYDHERNTSYKEDNDENTWTYTYNDHGQVLTERDPLWNTTTYVWDENLHLISFRDPNGNTTTYTYDEKGNRITDTDPLGNVTSYTYNSVNNKVATVTDPLGRVTKYEYDSKGNLTKVIRDYGGSLENETVFAYNSDGTTKSITDPLGNTTSFSYDTYGNQTGVTNAVGDTTSYSHDILGDLIHETDPRGNSTTFTYDLLNRITSVKDALNNATTYTYDANSNVSGITNAEGNATALVYNTYNQVTRITDALGNVTQFTYDKRGNRTIETDANGNATGYAYDVLDRRTAKTDSLGNVESYTYDTNNNVLSVTDANGNKTSSRYDSLNRVIKTTYPDGTFVSLSYDAAGNTASIWDRTGNRINHTYDSLNRLTRRTYPDATSDNYAYDLNENMISAGNADISYSFSYDALGRLIQVTNSTLGKTVSYAYLTNGLKSTMTNPEGGNTTFAYDALNRLTTLTDPQGEITRYSYDSLGRMTKKNLANGTYTNYSYDAANRLLSLTNKTSGDSLISNYNYTYDNTINRTSMTTPSGTHSYTYDSIYQLLQANHPSSSTEPYTYDPVHNRLTSADHSNWAYDSNNRLTGYNKTTFTYDANGNTLSKTDTSGATTYQYDFNNRLTRIDYPDGTYSEYAYDPFGNRIRKDLNGVVTFFAYDLTKQVPDVIAEYDNSGTLIANYTHGLRIDEVIFMRRGAKNYYYQTDGLGSITYLTDSTEAVVNTYEYDSFGNIISKAGSLMNPYGYTGRWMDSESGLMYYRARYYNSVIGRFISADPIAFAGGINFYAYVDNNPVNSIDPSGLGAGLLLLGLATAFLVVGVGALVFLVPEKKPWEKIRSKYNTGELNKILSTIRSKLQDIRVANCAEGAGNLSKVLKELKEMGKLKNIHFRAVRYDLPRGQGHANTNYNFIELRPIDENGNPVDIGNTILLYGGTVPLQWRWTSEEFKKNPGHAILSERYYDNPWAMQYIDDPGKDK